MARVSPDGYYRLIVLAANDLITRNAWLAFDSHVERQKVDGIVFTKAKLVRGMADYLNAHECGKYTRDRVRSALNRYMPKPPKVPNAFWRVEILDAFAYVTECRLHRLVAPGFGGHGDIEVASYAVLLSQTLGKHISERAMGEMLRSIRKSKQPKAYAQMMADMCVALIDCPTRSEAHERISRSILGSALWAADGKKRVSAPERRKSSQKQK